MLILYNDPWFTPSGSVKKKTIIDENGKTIEVFAMPTALPLCSQTFSVCWHRCLATRLFFISPKGTPARQPTKVFAMPTALSLCSHSSFMPARAVGATTGEPFAMPAAFLTPNSSLLTPHS